MISVIVPVYNVEPYLRKCLDSIINQTYRDLEILIIDDGSTDGSDEICDEYKNDERVRVFHTNNRGLSCARNLGLDTARGDWISFVDSDDWIETDMYDRAIDSISSADILCFCENDGILTGMEALAEIISEKINTSAWGKIYKRSIFSTIRYPVGRVYEDVATTYKLIASAKFIKCCNYNGYHYCKRPGSITTTHNGTYLIDYWLAIKERFDFYVPLLPNYSIEQRSLLYINILKTVALAIARAWGWRYASSPADSPEWDNMSRFARTMFPYSIRKHFRKSLHIGLLFARFNNPLSFWLADKAHKLMRRFRIAR